MESDRAIAQKLCIGTTHAANAGAGIVPSCAPGLRAGWDRPHARQGVLTTMDSSLLPQPALRGSLTPRDSPAGWTPCPTEKSVPCSAVLCDHRQTSGMQVEHGRGLNNPLLACHVIFTGATGFQASDGDLWHRELPSAPSFPLLSHAAPHPALAVQCVLNDIKQAALDLWQY